MKLFQKISAAALLIGAVLAVGAQAQSAPKKLRVGVSMQLSAVTEAKMAEAKANGITCIETGFGGMVKKSREFIGTEEELMQKARQAKATADKAGIEFWSVHMPYGETIDLSLANEQDRKEVVAMHMKFLKLCEILKPKIILFHPSWFLGLDERDVRKAQFVKSVKELNKAVKKVHATMVIENMLGPYLRLGNNTGKRERPLFRTVEEAVEMMGRVPKDVYSAIDLNHIANPEKLILAMGSRLKTLHVADGDGIEERHFFPCSGQGKNDWMAILAALDKVGYKGPFMFESAYPSFKDVRECYDSLYAKYAAQKASQ
ncbi:MAG: Beta-N-acetylhexosaminidase [Sphingobacteriaceae bacterium]|jgi:hexosaminidase|nr:Beta-N-acetylhexosaminidase [Sphingobacteriaceae bacterium]